MPIYTEFTIVAGYAKNGQLERGADIRLCDARGLIAKFHEKGTPLTHTDMQYDAKKVVPPMPSFVTSSTIKEVFRIRSDSIDAVFAKYIKPAGINPAEGRQEYGVWCRISHWQGEPSKEDKTKLHTFRRVIELYYRGLQ